jgi:Sel1 repeat
MVSQSCDSRSSNRAGLLRLYRTGKGVPQDYREAVRWFRMAAEQDDAHGQCYLGASYGEGAGVPQDWLLAYMWLHLGTAELQPGQLRETSARLRDIAAEMLTPAELARQRVRTVRSDLSMCSRLFPAAGCPDLPDLRGQAQGDAGARGDHGSGPRFHRARLRRPIEPLAAAAPAHGAARLPLSRRPEPDPPAAPPLQSRVIDAAGRRAADRLRLQPAALRGWRRPVAAASASNRDDAGRPDLPPLSDRTDARRPRSRR